MNTTERGNVYGEKKLMYRRQKTYHTTIRLGPTLPGFSSPNVDRVLVEEFNIKPISGAKEDIAAMMAGK